VGPGGGSVTGTASTQQAAAASGVEAAAGPSVYVEGQHVLGVVVKEEPGLAPGQWAGEQSSRAGVLPGQQQQAGPAVVRHGLKRGAGAMAAVKTEPNDEVPRLRAVRVKRECTPPPDPPTAGRMQGSGAAAAAASAAAPSAGADSGTRAGRRRGRAAAQTPGTGNTASGPGPGSIQAPTHTPAAVHMAELPALAITGSQGTMGSVGTAAGTSTMHSPATRTRSRVGTPAGGAHTPAGAAAAQVVVMSSSSLKDKELARAEAVVKRLGGRLVSSKDKDDVNFTHLLVGDGGFQRSKKTLIALAAGRPVVGMSWISSCAASNMFVVVRSEHLPDVSGAEKEFRFDLWSTYQRVQSSGPVLKGRRCFLSPGLLKQEKDAATLQQVVQHAGGGMLHDAGQVGSSDLVLGVDTDRRWAQSHLAPGTAVHPREVLIESVVRGCVEGRPLFVVKA